MPGVGALPPRTGGGGITTAKVVMPRSLTTAQRAVWKRLAPAAEQRGTLSAPTVHGFRVLVELVDRWERMQAQIDQDGWTKTNSFGEEKRHPLWGVWQALTVRVEQQMARFCLSADGKALAAAPATVNPWGQIAPAR